MDLLLNIISLIGPFILAGFIYSLKSINLTTKLILWVACAVILLFDLYLILKDKNMKRERTKRESSYIRLYDKQELFERDLPEIMIDSIKRNIFITLDFSQGQKQDQNHKLKDAIECYKQCLKQTGLPELDKVSLHILIGNDYYLLSQPASAEKYFKEAQVHLKKIEDERVKSLATAHILGSFGNIYHHLGKPDDALEYYMQALELNRNLAYEEGIAHNLRNIGTIYEELNQFEKALKNQKEALDIDKKMENNLGIAITMGNIGSIYNGLGQHENALKHLEKAITIFQEEENQEGTANIINRMGLHFSSQGDMEKAVIEYEKALTINRKIGNLEGMATNLGNIGLAYITLGNSQKALKYYQEALEVFEQMDAQPRKEILLKLIKMIQEEKIKTEEISENIQKEKKI